MKGSVELHGRNCDCKKATVPAFKMQVIGNKIMKNDELFSRLLNRRFRWEFLLVDISILCYFINNRFCPGVWAFSLSRHDGGICLYCSNLM